MAEAVAEEGGPEADSPLEEAVAASEMIEEEEAVPGEELEEARSAAEEVRLELCLDWTRSCANRRQGGGRGAPRGGRVGKPGGRGGRGGARGGGPGMKGGQKVIVVSQNGCPVFHM